MRAVERAKIFTIHGGGGLPAPACPGAGWGRDKTEDPFNAASPPPLSFLRPFVLFPFWALPKHHSPPPLLSVPLSHLPQRILANQHLFRRRE